MTTSFLGSEGRYHIKHCSWFCVGRVDFVVHGLRSSFRDWAAETTAYPNHVVEMALAHAIPNAVEAVYRRGDLFEKRRALMTAWAVYCAKPSASSAVIA